MQVAGDTMPYRADIMVGIVARAVFEFLSEPPALPFIGEPFGGDGGTTSDAASG